MDIKEDVMTQRKRGDIHVLNVYHELKKRLDNKDVENNYNITNQTALKLLKLFPDIVNVRNKFQYDHPDSQPDLTLTLSDMKEKEVNLFLIKEKANIQPKNMGAKSFLSKYFQMSECQKKFNNYFERRYDQYIIDFSKQAFPSNISRDKQLIKKRYPRFTKETEKFRVSFLFDIREECFDLLRHELNKEKGNFYNAISSLLLLDSINIITRYTKENKCSGVEEFDFTFSTNEEIKLYKKGNYSIGVRVGNKALVIRFKFESGPASSIKLVSSYESFPEKSEVLYTNKRDIHEFENLINDHTHYKSSNSSNAVGKCNEAIIYYRILKKHPYVYQVDSQEFKGMLEKYYTLVNQADLKNIEESSIVSVKKLELYLKNKYKLFSIESIQLVPDSYIQNRLDNTDLLLTINCYGKIIQEHISLKAIRKRGAKITVKNAGIGKILGEQYFNIGALDEVVSKVRERYYKNLIDLKSCLSEVSNDLGHQLLSASQENLIKGLQSIVGDSTVLITFYRDNDSKIIEHGNINGKVQVFPSTPTPIQTKLEWDNNEEIFIRVKFSGSQKKGWTSMKVACEYVIS